MREEEAIDEDLAATNWTSAPPAGARRRPAQHRPPAPGRRHRRTSSRPAPRPTSWPRRSTAGCCSCPSPTVDDMLTAPNSAARRLLARTNPATTGGRVRVPAHLVRGASGRPPAPARPVGEHTEQSRRGGDGRRARRPGRRRRRRLGRRRAAGRGEGPRHDVGHGRADVDRRAGPVRRHGRAGRERRPASTPSACSPRTTTARPAGRRRCPSAASTPASSASRSTPTTPEAREVDPRPRPLGRHRDRVVLAQGDEGVGPGLRVAAPGEAGPDHAELVPVRPGRPVLADGRLRDDGRGHRRDGPAHRLARPAAGGSVRRLHRRLRAPHQHGGAARRARAPAPHGRGRATSTSPRSRRRCTT